MKLSLEEKVEYVLQYNREDVIKTLYDAACRSAIMKSLRGWAKRYNEEGEAGLRRKRKKTCTFRQGRKAAANDFIGERFFRRIWNVD